MLSSHPRICIPCFVNLLGDIIIVFRRELVHAHYRTASAGPACLNNNAPTRRRRPFNSRSAQRADIRVSKARGLPAYPACMEASRF